MINKNKIAVHISSTGKGGPGNVIKDVIDVLSEANIENVLFTPRDIILESNQYIIGKIDFVLSRVLSKLYEKKAGNSFIGKTFWPEVCCTNKINHMVNCLGTKKPIIFILYWYKNFVDYKTIYSIRKLYPKAQIFIYLMDYAPLTGGCHYPYECNSYNKGCTFCPIFKVKEKSICSNNAILMKECMEKCHVKILAPTTEAFNLSKESFIGMNLQTHLLFIPVRKKEINCDYLKTFDPKKKYICLVAQDVADKRKGFKNAIEILNFCFNHLECDVRKNIHILIVGNCTETDASELRFEKTILGYLSIEKLYTIFSLSILFLSTSIADMGPMTVTQALLYGTPVASYAIGIAKDLIIDGVTGYISDVGDILGLSKKVMNHINKNYDEIKKMKLKCDELTSAKVEYSTFKSQITDIFNLEG